MLLNNGPTRWGVSLMDKIGQGILRTVTTLEMWDAGDRELPRAGYSGPGPYSLDCQSAE
jgi:hypothetical protein